MRQVMEALSVRKLTRDSAGWGEGAHWQCCQGAERRKPVQHLPQREAPYWSLLQRSAARAVQPHLRCSGSLRWQRRDLVPSLVSSTILPNCRYTFAPSLLGIVACGSAREVDCDPQGCVNQTLNVFKLHVLYPSTEQLMQ